MTASVFDTFIFRDELDMLECRLRELESLVDWFVIVEAGVTHGECQPKPFYLEENYHRFRRWWPKMRYITVGADEMPAGPDPWTREHAQREFCWEGMMDVGPGDLVLHGDLDEIPSCRALESVMGRQDLCVFEQRLTHFAVDWLSPNSWWLGTVASPHRLVQGFQWLRCQREHLPRVPRGGWHLSSLGTEQDQVNHVRWGCHVDEYCVDGNWDGIVSGRNYREGWFGSLKLIPAEVDDSWPRYIYERRCPDTWFRPRGSNG